MVPIASLLLLLFGWLISAAPGVWSLVVGLAIAIPALAPLLDRLARRVQGTVYGWRGAADELVRTAVMIAFLPHQAWLSMDAIVRAVYRRRISRRQLLEWQTAEAAGTQAHRHMNDLPANAGDQRPGGDPDDRAAGAGFVFSRLVFPGLLDGVSADPDLAFAPGRDAECAARSIAPTNCFLRRMARRTWRYFDDLVNPESSWLPPDNTQLALRVEVAQRTSPTNIGLWLASALAATDFGYLTIDEFLDRCGKTFATIDRLERYEGHLLNWYDTQYAATACCRAMFRPSIAATCLPACGCWSADART